MSFASDGHRSAPGEEPNCDSGLNLVAAAATIRFTKNVYIGNFVCTTAIPTRTLRRFISFAVTALYYENRYT